MSQNTHFRLDIPAAHKYLHILGANIAAVMEGFDDVSDKNAVIYNIQLAIQEVCTNIVKYAYTPADPGGRIELTLSLFHSPRKLMIETVDSGLQTFCPATVPEPGTDQDGGRGLFLIRRLTDEVVYCAADGQSWKSEGGGNWQKTSPPTNCTSQQKNYWRIIKYF